MPTGSRVRTNPKIKIEAERTSNILANAGSYGILNPGENSAVCGPVEANFDSNDLEGRSVQ